MRRSIALLAAVLAAACAGRTPATPPPTAQAGACAIPPSTYADLEACRGTSEQIELEIADSRAGKTTAKIAIPSKDPAAILAAMGSYAVEWSRGADSFSVFAFG